MTAIIDYGVGNLFSLISSFEKIGEEAVITAEPSVLAEAERIVLPGVGAFRDAMEKLKASGLIPALNEQIAKGKPVMGICLGMQLLFDKSFEYGEHAGLGIIPGEIRPINAKGLKIPHMGWNSLTFCGNKHPLFSEIKNGDFVYFVHSFYAANCSESIIATTEYGITVTAAVAKDNVMGCQFHPEKSGEIGLSILKAFCKMKEGALC